MASQPPRRLHLDDSQSLSATQILDSASLLSPRTPTKAGLNNPLATKVTSVLSASYADAEFRDSLALLDERHIQNNAETRRRLRLDVQKEVIDSNGEVIVQFGRVAEQLRRIGGTIDELNRTYDAMKAEVEAGNRATKPVLDEASGLIDRRRNVETRRRLLNAFVGHFVLTDDEVAALTFTAEPVDDRFFAVLAKAKKISKDCEILLGFEEANQSLGAEIMEQTSKHINLGYQKLYKWVQRSFRNLNLENPQIGSAMSRALRVLAERPTLFQSCLDSFAEARESILSDAFYTALTGNSSNSSSSSAGGGGGGGGSDNNAGQNGAGPRHAVKPIELAAHDPLRYAGDMLAWTHSATVSEREALEALFVGDGGELARGIQEGRANEAWRRAAYDDDENGDDDEDEDGADGTAAFDPIKALNHLVGRDLAGVARLLRQRMEQVMQANEDTILAFKLANLLNFYRLTFGKLLGGGGNSSNSPNQNTSNGNPAATTTTTTTTTTNGNHHHHQHQHSHHPPSLVDTLQGLETEALRHFRALVRDRVAALQGEFAHAPSDPAPPEFLQDALEQLVAIMKTYDTSFLAVTAPSSFSSSSSSSTDSREADFVPVLAEALDPFLAGCAKMAERAANDVDRHIFLANCLTAARETLTPFDSFTAGRVAQLQQAIDDASRGLAESQYGFFCEQSGLEALIAALRPLRADSSRGGDNDDSQADEDLRRAATTLALLQPEALAGASQRLDDFLPSALMDAVENLRPLQDPKLARQLTEAAAERFCVDFEHVEAVLDAIDRQRRDDARRDNRTGEDDSDNSEHDGNGGGDGDESGTTLRALFPRTSVEIRVLLS
ncbi:hypothetical protein SPI_08757 [Niveomyces insectorum RCEF 264]|uniref:Conserved oligomeric Golgi complex subunit 6 n=1 Tax=Niveomyces insectorum RCEF 264 TaxID=1081102 RepID=A0A167MLQ9_9HYPO|nr:hypothetical protein SPI_08757 [Niveomyces insectorum RCEF 264]